MSDIFGLSFPATIGTGNGPLTARTSAGEVPTGRYFVTVGGERLDQVAYTVYGVQSGAVEALLIVNPGLASYGLTLPADLAIILPDLEVQSAQPSREVRLWG